jgi:hypothetical protein
MEVQWKIGSQPLNTFYHWLNLRSHRHDITCTNNFQKGFRGRGNFEKLFNDQKPLKFERLGKFLSIEFMDRV